MFQLHLFKYNQKKAFPGFSYRKSGTTFPSLFALPDPRLSDLNSILSSNPYLKSWIYYITFYPYFYSNSYWAKNLSKLNFSPGLVKAPGYISINLSTSALNYLLPSLVDKSIPLNGVDSALSTSS